MNAFRPEQLPSQSVSFIAYGPQMRAANPATGEPMTIRPQTFVRYYKHITVTNIGPGRTDNVTHVEFDPASVGMKEPISANLDPSDHLVQVLTAAMNNNRPVDVAIEVSRKATDHADNSPIGPFTHIHALRGATRHPNGKDATMNRASDTTRKMIVMVNGQPGQAIISNPLEWAQLRANTDGTLPPEGWTTYSPGTLDGGTDWTTSVIIPAETATTGLDGIDAGGLEALLTKVINHVLDQREGDRSNIKRRTNAPATEGTVFEVRNSNGTINLGSYAVSALSTLYRWADTYLTGLDVEHTIEQTWEFTNNLATAIDRVQVAAYEGKLGVNRIKRSWSVASTWVTYTIEHGEPLSPDVEDAQAMIDAIITQAVAHLTHAGELTNTHYIERAKIEREQRSNRADAPDRDEVIANKLRIVKAAWNNARGLHSAYDNVKEAGILDAVISITTDDDGKPVLTYPAADGQATGELGELIVARGQELIAATEQDTTGATSQAATPDATQAEQASPAAQQQGQDGQGAPRATAPAMSPAAVAYMKRLARGVTADELRAAYEHAKANNLLTTLVQAKVTGNTVSYDAAANPRPISDVLNELRINLTPAQTAAEQAPTTQDTTAADTQQETAAQTGDDETPGHRAPTAQDYADSAKEADPADVEALKEQAIAAGLDEHDVTIDGETGTLLSYLNGLLG